MVKDDATGERWLPTIGYAKGVRYDYTGLYETSDLGQVRSLDRLIGGPHGPASRIFPGRVLQPWINAGTRGYPFVSLSQENVVRHWPVHILVLCTFVGLPKPDQEARHGRGGKADASLINLCWGTREENVGPDRLRDGQSNRGEKSGLAKLTWDQVVEMRWRVLLGESQRNVAKTYGVHFSTVSSIIRGDTWKYPPEEW